MTTGKVTITAPNGMHARPAGELVKLIRGLAPARITLRTAAREASAVSILSLLALGLKHGTEVEVCAEGGDEAAAVRAVTDFIAGIRECVAAAGADVTDAGLAVEDRVVRAVSLTENAREGVAAFLEKRPAVFR